MTRPFYAWALIALLPMAALGDTTVEFTIDAAQDVHPISRWIYGVNQPIGGPLGNLTFIRFGGNRTTAYNWVTNASNAGNDYHFNNDGFMRGGNTPGGAIIPTLRNAYENHAGALITIPTNGYVSADENGPVDIHDPARFKTRFKQELPEKGSPFTLTPDPAGPIVYQDEFVNWMKTNYGYGLTDAQRPIFFELDNEPDIWASTHPEVHPAKVTYAEILDKTIAYSKAIKSIEPGALVYGPVNYGWGGIVNLQSAADAHGRDFETFYLSALSKASAAAGERLLDALDIHWYPEATGGGIRVAGPEVMPAVNAARLQAPRSLWDSTYVETSWVTRDSLHGKPIDLIPRLRKIIAANFPGTKLSISEYNYGGGSDISGAIAEADVLGIFGKLGIFSANEWPGGNEAFIAAGLSMYRNFDGQNGVFGDTSIATSTSDVPDTSIYASTDSAHPDRLIAVTINKTASPIRANLLLKNSGAFRSAEIYQLTQVQPKPVRRDNLTRAGDTPFSVDLPPYSVTTIRFLN